MSEPIAIVGMGAIFPGAGTAPAFWRNITGGVDATSEVPPSRWDPELYYDPDSYDGPPESDRLYCRRGGFVDDLATFDPSRFGIMPSSVPGTEPDQLLALRAAAEAIAGAGGVDRLPPRERIGVVMGRGGYLTPGLARFDQQVTAAHQLTRVLEELVPELDRDRLDEIGAAFRARVARCEDSGGLVPSFAASRVADRFDLRGPAYTLDAACASALLAVEHAVRALRSGQCDAMLAGAVHHAHHATVWSMFSRLRVLSRSGRIRPFDASADGTLLSEGTGIVLLKRLADAERDGDRVHAVIRGCGSSSDGRAGGILSPLVDGQVLAVERAWADAGLDPAQPDAAGLVEAHGTGAPAADEAEIATLRRVFGDAPMALGSVKSMIGHAMPAAGIAGLIKAVCALRDGVLPPTLHVDEPHPALAGTNLRPIQELTEWEAPGAGPRRAVVNAFGFGGTNAHIVLEEHPSSSPTRGGAPPSTRETEVGMRLDLGTPLVRLDGAVPPLSLAIGDHDLGCWPELPSRDPVMAELDALLREATTGAQSVVDALGTSGVSVTAEKLTTNRTFSIDAMPFLADYCVIAQPLGWPNTSDRFPVVPLATLLEVMAEAARELLPELVVVGYEDVSAQQWLVANPATTADVRVHLAPDSEDGMRRVKAAIEGHAEGTVLFAERYPPVPLRRLDDRAPLDGEGPPPVTARQLYDERWMFHGPRFQTVSEITVMAADGLRGVLTSSNTPGALLDGAGQLCAHWIQVYGEKDQTTFPTQIGRIVLYGPPPPEGARLEATVWNRSMSETAVTYDAELVRTPGGALWGRVEGLTARRYATDEATWRMKFTPELAGVGEPQPGGWCLARRHWDGAASRDLLMRQYLGAAERDTYQRLRSRERGPWLLGRIAIKDAVRHWLWELGRGPLFPAELTVHDDGIGGRPVVTGPFREEISVAVACTARLGVALVRPVPAPTGIAIEQLPDPERPDGAAADAVWRTTRAAAAMGTSGASIESRRVDGHVVAWTALDG